MKPSFSIKIVLGESWQAVKTNRKFFVLLTLLLWGIQAIRQLVVGSLVNPSLAYFTATLVFMLVNTAMTLGLINLSLNFLKLKRTSFTDLTAKISLFWPYFVSSIYYGLIVLAGMILLLIPGVIWAIRYQFFGYIIVDQGLKPKEALAKSKELTNGHGGQLFLFGLALLGLNLLGLLALVVGLLVTIPMSLLASAKVYQLLSGTSSNGLSTSENSIARNSATVGQPTNVWKSYRQS